MKKLFIGISLIFVIFIWVQSAYADEPSGYYIENNTIHITGEIEEFTVILDDVAYEDYFVEPGDSDYYTLGVVDDSKSRDYMIVDYSHELYFNFIDGYDLTWHLNRLNKFDPTYKWIMENCEIKSINEENVLSYMNTMNETLYIDTFEAIKHNFFNRCFNMEYNIPLDCLEIDGEYTVVTWSLDGPNTDNIYQNCEFGWIDTITFKKIKEEEPVEEPEDEPIVEPDESEEDELIVIPDTEPEDEPIVPDCVDEDTNDSTPIIKPTEQYNEEIKDKISSSNIPKTGDETNILLFIILIWVSLGICIFCKNKIKK